MGTGKIARLPVHIREQVNRRLEKGDNGRDISAWLNSNDEVKAVLAQEFDGQPLNDVNLSHWRQGGYRDWEAQQFALAEAGRILEEGHQLGEAGQGALADHLAKWVIGQYMVATRRMREKMESGDDAGAWKLLRELCHDVVTLRRGDQGAEWLRLEQERLNLQRQKQEITRARLKEEIRQENPPAKAMTEEEQEDAWRQIFGMQPKERPFYEEEPLASAEPTLPQESEPADESDQSEPSDDLSASVHPAKAETPPTATAPPEDPEVRELRELIAKAEQGHAYSAYSLGACYRDGHGVPRDYARARDWLEKAARLGLGAAKIELAALLARPERAIREALADA